jgi:hypothetical protein
MMHITSFHVHRQVASSRQPMFSVVFRLFFEELWWFCELSWYFSDVIWWVSEEMFWFGAKITNIWLLVWRLHTHVWQDLGCTHGHMAIIRQIPIAHPARSDGFRQ